jgi:hypothetical protein
MTLRERTMKSRNRMLVYEYLREHPCVDCGETDTVVLEFDHLRDKVAGISVLANRQVDWEVIAAEIEKCDVVCANCHRRRTCARLGSFRYIISRGLDGDSNLESSAEE